MLQPCDTRCLVGGGISSAKTQVYSFSTIGNDNHTESQEEKTQARFARYFAGNLTNKTIDIGLHVVAGTESSIIGCYH